MAQQRALPIGRGLFFIAFAAISWGIGGFVAALLYRHSGLGPFAVSFWRYVGGLALLGAIRPVLKRDRTWRVGRRRMIVNGVGFALYQTAYYLAVDLSGLGIATLVTIGAGPVLVAVGARLFLGERLSRVGLVIVVASLAGLVLLVSDDSGTGSNPALGIAVALLSAAGYAGVTLLNRRSTDDALDSAFGGFAVGGICLFPLALFEGLLPARDGLAETAGLLVFLGAVPTALAYALFFAGLAVVRATTASIVSLVEPVAAAVLAVGVLHERLSLSAMLGGLLLVAAVAALTVEEHRNQPIDRVPVNA